MSYRFDKRTKEQFAKDMVQCHLIERALMSKYVDWLNRKAKKSDSYDFKDNGVSNDGRLIENDKEIKAKADFILIKNKNVYRSIDIKFSRKHYNKFHLKINQLKTYLKNDVAIVNWMGIDTDKPMFCIIIPKDIADLLENGEQTVMWGKQVIRCYNKDFVWHEYQLG